MILRTLGLIAALLAAPAAQAEEWGVQGVGRLFANDLFGDAKDRWRTGSYVLSVVTGPTWHGTRPEAPLRLLDWRLRTEIIAPSRLNGRGSLDRRMVAAISLGVHAHQGFAGGDLSYGIDAVVTGPQTRLAEFQDWYHAQIDAPNVSDLVRARQIPDGVYPLVTAEYARAWPVAQGLRLRPYVESQAGPEDMLRVGADLLIGAGWDGALLLRDNPTGMLYPGARLDGAQPVMVMGFDSARIFDSEWLPGGSEPSPEDWRHRARFGIEVPVGPARLFYGLAWLSPEVEGQEDSQVSGSLRLDFTF